MVHLLKVACWSHDAFDVSNQGEQTWQVPLLIGRSSTTKLGLFVLAGIIDSNYEGEILITLWTPMPPCFIPAGQCLAQPIFQHNPWW